MPCSIPCSIPCLIPIWIPLFVDSSNISSNALHTFTSPQYFVKNAYDMCIHFNQAFINNFLIDSSLTEKIDAIVLISNPLSIIFRYISSGSLTLAHSQNSQMSFMYGFFFVKFLFFTVVCVVIVI